MMIKFNEVTWYSKWATFIFFTTVVPVLSFIIGMRYTEVKTVEQGSVSESADTVSLKRAIIERDYPEFVDFENQESFAGHSVQIRLLEGEYYFAYVVHGSGLPFVKATCFRTDRVRAYKVGEYPDPTDSVIGHTDIDPSTCRGTER